MYLNSFSVQSVIKFTLLVSHFKKVSTIQNIIVAKNISNGINIIMYSASEVVVVCDGTISECTKFHIVSVVLLEHFRALKPILLEHFRALKTTTLLENFRAFKPSPLEHFRALKTTVLQQFTTLGP